MKKRLPAILGAFCFSILIFISFTTQAQSQIVLPDDQNAGGDMVYELIYANGYVFAYSLNGIKVFNSNAEYKGYIPIIDEDTTYGKFNPVYYNPRLWSGSSNFMVYNDNANVIYALTPNLDIKAISASPETGGVFNSSSVKQTYSEDTITLPNYLRPLHRDAKLRFDTAHNRLYTAIGGKDPFDPQNCTGTFHAGAKFIGIYNSNQNGAISYFTSHVFNDSATNTYYKSNVADIAFNVRQDLTRDVFYIARLSGIDVYWINDTATNHPKWILDKSITYSNIYTNGNYKFGKFIDYYKDSIYKIIATPYRYDATLAQGKFPLLHVINGFHADTFNSEQDIVTFNAPSKRIIDAHILKSTKDLIVCYAPNSDEIMFGGDTNDIAIFEFDESTNSFETTPSEYFCTNQSENISQYDINSPLKCLFSDIDTNVMISKKDQIVELVHDSSGYSANEVLQESENAFYYGGINLNDGKKFVINGSKNSIEVFDYDTVNLVYYKDTSIVNAYPVYHIAGSLTGNKIYMFNKLNIRNAGFYVYNPSTGSIDNINIDDSTNNDINNAIGDCIYNPYLDHFLVTSNSENPDETFIKVYKNDNSNTLYKTIDLSPGESLVKHATSMFISEDQKLYVLTNMRKENNKPNIKVKVYNAGNDDGQTNTYLKTYEYSSPTSVSDQRDFFHARFCENPINSSIYITITPAGRALTPYNIENNAITQVGSEDQFINEGCLLRIENDIIRPLAMKYPIKPIFPYTGKPGVISKYGRNIIVIGSELVVYDYQNDTTSTHQIDSTRKLIDVMYIPEYDQLFCLLNEQDPTNTGCQHDRVFSIYELDFTEAGSDTLVEIYSGDGQSAGFFFNKFEGSIYVYNKFDDEKLAGTPVNIVKIDYDPDASTQESEIIDSEYYSLYADYDYNTDYHYYFNNIITPYIDPYSNKIYFPNGTFSSVSSISFSSTAEEVIPYNYTTSGGSPVPNWISFPRIEPDSGSIWQVLGEETKRIDPDYDNGSFITTKPIGYSSTQTNTFTNSLWDRSNTFVSIERNIGYKLSCEFPSSTPESFLVHLFGDVLSPASQTNLSSVDYNWMGYYIPLPQFPLDAIHDSIEDNIKIIKGRYWTCINDTPGVPDGPQWECECSRYSTAMRYGDLIKIKTNNDSIPGFQWQIQGQSIPQVDRLESSYFSYSEQPDYTPYFIEMDSSANPLEIGAFVNDSCVGATSVLPEDTTILVQVYNDGLSGEVTFEEYYGNKFSANGKKIKDYYVWDKSFQRFVNRNIHTSENMDYYKISFKTKRKKRDLIMHSKTSIKCSPNPTSSELKILIEGINEEQLLLVLYDIYGTARWHRKLQTIDQDSHFLVLDLESCIPGTMKAGTYFLTLKGQNTFETVKVIVQN